MADMPADTLLHAVHDVARVAGDVALRRFGSRLTVERKRDGSEVTLADREAEHAAREWVARHFPADGIEGEELGVSGEAARRRWMIDPIDGTRTYVRGVPLWGTLVAVLEREEVLAGAAYFPAVAEILAAAPRQGCWWNGSRAMVSPIESLDGALVLCTDPRFSRDESGEQRAAWSRLADRAATSRTWGDCYGYLLVATGRAEVMVDGILAAWDAAPFLPIIEEAGGAFTDWRGRRTIFGRSAIATNGALARAARTILGGGRDE